MPIKKSELYSSLWQSCDELRGGMDASQYKDYVLVLLFMKYVSDKATSQKGYLLDVPKGGGFADMVALKGDKEIGDKINKIIGRLADANDLKGVIDVADFNDADKLGKGKEMVDRLSNLVAIFDTPALDFRSNRAEGDDLLGAEIFLERKKILSQESCIDNNMMGFFLDDKVAHHRFVHYLFLNIQLGKLVAATALPSLNGREIAGLEFGIPNSPEQRAIATVLSDMDAELAALEARLAKTRALKQGMMQDLLTGRTRLV